MNGYNDDRIQTPNLRIITLNVQMLPSPVGDDTKNRPRAEKICQTLIEKEYDLICLQELFDEEMRDIFAEKLLDKYPSMIKKADEGNIFRQDSGLFIASKYPFIKQDEVYYFEAFNDCGKADCFAEKGVMAVRIDLAELKEKFELIVFNTHLQSDQAYVGEFKDVRFKQMQQIRRLLQKSMNRIIPARHDDTAAVLVGDMNINGESEEYRDLLNILEYARDIYRETYDDTQQYSGYTWDYEFNKNMIPSSDRDRLRLDYILSLDHIPAEGGASKDLHSLNCRECFVQLFGEEDDVNSRLSDHFAVEAVLTV